MARTMHFRDFAFEAYARSRAKRDRGKREGPDHQINGAGARNVLRSAPRDRLRVD